MEIKLQQRIVFNTDQFALIKIIVKPYTLTKVLLNQIFEEMRIEFYKKYPISVTFINKINVISEIAHTKKLGWEIIDEFEFNNNTYIGLAFDMKNSVLQ